jgi:hypothetical protein
MTNLIDDVNFKDLASYDPEEVIARTGSEYNKSKNEYVVKIWGHNYIVRPYSNEILPEKEGLPTYKDYFYLFMLFYLMKSKDLPISGEWVSEKDVPGGAAFFRGPHTIPTNDITQVYENDLEKFKNRCEALGGTPIEHADAAYSFEIANNIPVAVLYWIGDEDFESEAKLLFDKTIGEHLPLDIIYALAVEVCNTIKNSPIV